MLNKVDGKISVRTVIILCLEETKCSTVVRYLFEGLSETYIFSRIPDFATSIEALIQQERKSNRFILVNYDPVLTLQILRLIYKYTDEESRQRAQESFISSLAQQLGPEVSETLLQNASSLIKPSKGQAEFSIASLAILQDYTDATENWAFEEGGVFNQQLLRYLALKHGGVYAAVSGLGSVLNDFSACDLLANKLWADEPVTSSVIFNSQGTRVSQDLILHQYVPMGWDAWSKIMLSASSLVHDVQRNTSLDSQAKLDQLDGLYNNYMRTEVVREKSLTDGCEILDNNAEINLSLLRILKMEHEAS